MKISNLIFFPNHFGGAQSYTYRRGDGDIFRLSDAVESELEEKGIDWRYWNFQPEGIIIEVPNSEDVALIKLAYDCQGGIRANVTLDYTKSPNWDDYK